MDNGHRSFGTTSCQHKKLPNTPRNGLKIKIKKRRTFRILLFGKSSGGGASDRNSNKSNKKRRKRKRRSRWRQLQKGFKAIKWFMWPKLWVEQCAKMKNDRQIWLRVPGCWQQQVGAVWPELRANCPSESESKVSVLTLPWQPLILFTGSYIVRRDEIVSSQLWLNCSLFKT